ncbi:DNA gyrase inhibitor YacG [Paracoccus jiaweipingae]|uniref:DNA gyrase inhibitor YacG n=1 Tax=unclassified Paracoccus (in: a-proteobacteria) TaxID=2688777 RepID=UPI0037B405BB
MTRCPICGKPADPKLRPFCSKRCADIDLARWLRGDYAIPGEPAGTPETED